MHTTLRTKLSLLSIVMLLISACTHEPSATDTKELASGPDTTVNEAGRLLPRKLRHIPFGIIAQHSPNPCYADQEEGKYVWKHNTTVMAGEDLQIVEYGSFLHTKQGWYLRVTYTAKDFDEHYGTKNGVLKKDSVYTDPTSWRMSDSLFAGDALWYYIAVDKNGNKVKGIAPVETEGITLAQYNIQKGYQNFSLPRSMFVWTGYGEVGSYSLSGNLRLKNGVYQLSKDTLKFAQLTLDMLSLTSKQENLEEHLKGNDFFDVVKYPTAIFTLVNPVQQNNKMLLKGTLTIKNVTKQVIIPVNHTLQGKKHIYEGTLSLDRTEFNVKYNSKSFFSNLGDQAIKNKIDIAFSVETE